MGRLIDRLNVDRSVGPAGGWSRQLGRDTEHGGRFLVSRQAEAAAFEGDAKALEGAFRLASRLRHPGLCPVVETGVDGDGPFVVEKIGDALPIDEERSHLPRGERLGRELLQLLEALAYLHRHGVTHGAVSRHTVVSDGRSLRLTGNWLKPSDGAASDDVVRWAELARDLLPDEKQAWVNARIRGVTDRLLRRTREERSPSAVDVADTIRTALLKRKQRSEFDEETEIESRAMKILFGALHFVGSLLVGVLTTAVTVALIAGIVALGVLKFVGDLPPEVTVPSVVGSTEHEARETVSQQDLSVGNIRRVYSEDARPGEVIGASPEVGMTVREGRKLTLIVSRGAARVRVPRLIGLHPDEARKILKERGLTPVDGGRVRSSAPEGEIVRQDPPSGQKLAQGERVEFHVSGGEGYGTVVVEGEDGESKRMLFRRLEIVAPAGDALQRVEVKEGYDELEATYSRLHRPGDEVRLDVRGKPGKRIAVIIEGERVFQTQL